MKIFFYCLFVIDIIIGAVLAYFLNFVIGLITALVLLFINLITFSVILEMQRKKRETEIVDNMEKFKI